MLAMARSDALEQVVAARVVGIFNKVNAGAVDGNRVERGEDADVLHARIFGDGTAIAIDGHVAHDVDKSHVAVKMRNDGRGSVGHGFEELVLLGDVAPELVLVFGFAGGVNPGFASRRGDADRELLKCAAIAAHRVTFEMRKYEHGIVIVEILADEVLFDDFAVWNFKRRVGLGVHNIDREVIGPAVIFDELLMFLGGIASAFVGGIALDDSAVDMFDDRAHKFRMEVVLVTFFAGVNLDGNFAGELFAEFFIDFDNVFGGDVFDKVDG